MLTEIEYFHLIKLISFVFGMSWLGMRLKPCKRLALFMVASCQVVTE
jgi:hypothetical protein